jgi:hypothetical protein
MPPVSGAKRRAAWVGMHGRPDTGRVAPTFFFSLCSFLCFFRFSSLPAHTPFQGLELRNYNGPSGTLAQLPT